MVDRCMINNNTPSTNIYMLINMNSERGSERACVCVFFFLKKIGMLASHFEISVHKKNHRFGKYICITDLMITCISYGWD